MRSYNRLKTDLTVECEVGGVREVAQLYNLSCGGCMIEIAMADLQEEAQIAIALSQRTSFPGKIAWRVGKNAGIKFDLPLHPSVIEKMGYGGDGEQFDRHDPRDRFGLPLVERMHVAAGRMDPI